MHCIVAFPWRLTVLNKPFIIPDDSHSSSLKKIECSVVPFWLLLAYFLAGFPMSFSRSFRVEAKDFQISASNGGLIKLSEWSRKNYNTIFPWKIWSSLDG